MVWSKLWKAHLDVGWADVEGQMQEEGGWLVGKSRVVGGLAQGAGCGNAGRWPDFKYVVQIDVTEFVPRL